MAQHDHQRLYRVECWCGETFEGCGPWDWFVHCATGDGWQDRGKGRWRCPECSDAGIED
jgi:hypothetical protein